MAKWADYLISGVFFTIVNNSKRISHVMLHADTDTNFGIGVKTSEKDVIALIKSGKSIVTITWNYPEWRIGAQVEYETTANGELLRTKANSETRDNLDNSFNYYI